MASRIFRFLRMILIMVAPVTRPCSDGRGCCREVCLNKKRPTGGTGRPWCLAAGPPGP
jgi:hypothetical protein